MTPTDTSTEKPEAAGRRRRLLVAIPLLTLVAAGVAGIIWFFGRTAPDPVDLADTATAVEEVAEVTTGEDDAATGNGIDGTWTVDTSVGTFAFEEATASFAGFRIEEELAGVGSATAVGRTPELTGTLSIDGTTIREATIEADMTAIVSNDSRRDDRIQQALDTGSKPSATFTLSDPIDLGDVPAEGETVEVTATGELTINGVSREMQIPLQAQLGDGMILVVGSTDVVFSDYDVALPSSPAVLSVEDHGTLELQMWLTPQA